MKCPFCYMLGPTWDHVQACGIRAREEQEKQDRRRRIEGEKRRKKSIERDRKNGTWHGWSAR